MDKNDIINFLNSNNYNLRISNNGRWIDQKCTPDVLWSVSDFILNYVENICSEFTPRTVWDSDYAMQTISDTYRKPNTDDESAQNEYDKVFSQPMCMLCNAKVLKDISPTNRHTYVVAEPEILNFIALSDRNALFFIQEYVEKVLKDSGVYSYFEEFFDFQDKEHFQSLKIAFTDFTIANTKINTAVEVHRIFTKVLNPLSFKRHKRGTVHGALSAQNIAYDELMYNRANFRDIYAEKPREMSRKDWLKAHPDIQIRTGLFEQQMNVNIRVLKDFNLEYRNGISDFTLFIENENDNELATQAHHIFPKSDFPTIKHYLENLIMLTPNQHYLKAHENNNTHYINTEVQKLLLIAQTYSIKENINNTEEETIYDFNKFLQVIATGWNDENFLQINENDFIDLLHAINYHPVAE